MAEKVTTGGLKTFHYGKDYNPKLNDERKKEIREAYERYYERKAREKRNKTIMIIFIILAIIILLILAVAFLRNS